MPKTDATASAVDFCFHLFRVEERLARGDDLLTQLPKPAAKLGLRLEHRSTVVVAGGSGARGGSRRGRSDEVGEGVDHGYSSKSLADGRGVAAQCLEDYADPGWYQHPPGTVAWKSEEVPQGLAEAVSRREVEENAAGVKALEARLDAAQRDLDAARAARTGKTAGAEPIGVAAPFDGRVAQIEVTPGQAVAAGTTLGRLVKTDPVWLRVALHPAEAAQVDGRPAGLLVTAPGSAERSFEPAAFRVAARSPEVDTGTGTLGVFFELSGAELPLGSTVETEILLAELVEGIVIPSSALVDDGGTLVVFVQLEGESFGRQPVQVLARQGELALVEGLVEGQRLVTRGGAEIRRSSLLAGGEVEGHVH